MASRRAANGFCAYFVCS